MKKFSKIISYIVLLVILFFLINMLIWVIKYRWIDSYSTYLNNKDRNETIYNFRIWRPKTRVSLFYWEMENISDDTSLSNLENLNEDIIDTLTWDSNHDDENIVNPYDPEYEDEFNSFFWTKSDDINEINIQDTTGAETEIWDDDLLEWAWFKIE